MIINVHELTSLYSVLRTTIVTPVKPQISKFKAEKSYLEGFNMLRRFYSLVFVNPYTGNEGYFTPSTVLAKTRTLPKKLW